MSGYPWIYWLVVLIVAGALSAVLMGIGYLIGRRVAFHESMEGLRAIEQSAARLRQTINGTFECKVPR